MLHGFVQRPMHKVEGPTAAIADTLNSISDFTGVPHRIKYQEALYIHLLGNEGMVVSIVEEILDWCGGQTGSGAS